jgi:hypothetical protein
MAALHVVLPPGRMASWDFLPDELDELRQGLELPAGFVPAARFVEAEQRRGEAEVASARMISGRRSSP